MKNREAERKKLLAQIESAWPKYRAKPSLVKQVELASNDELRNHLSWARMLSDARPVEPTPRLELSSRKSLLSREIFQRVLATRWNPYGAYTLARDECGDWYDGPDWLPFNLYGTAGPCGGTAAERACAKTLIESVHSEKLWADIAARHSVNAITGAPSSSVDSIAGTLPRVCADAQANWLAIPRLTPAKYKSHQEELARRADQLAIALERFYLPRDPDECELPGLFDFPELMTQEETDRLDLEIRATTFCIANRTREAAGIRGMDWDEYNDIGQDARNRGWRPGDIFSPARQDAHSVYSLLQRDHTDPREPFFGVPPLPDLLRRIAFKFREDAKDPPIKNPNLGNAERNFFARFLCKYFWRSYALVSPAIIRDIVTMFYPQSITENDVSQMVARIKAAFPLPPDPENSPSK